MCYVGIWNKWKNVVQSNWKWWRIHGEQQRLSLQSRWNSCGSFASALPCSEPIREGRYGYYLSPVFCSSDDVGFEGIQLCHWEEKANSDDPDVSQRDISWCCVFSCSLLQDNDNDNNNDSKDLDANSDVRQGLFHGDAIFISSSEGN